MNEKLKFNSIPKNWEEFLPLGNGRLGCMVKTHPCNEVIQLNEEGIWSGSPIDRINPDARKNLPKIRKSIKNGNVKDAQELAFQSMSGTCFNERVYQTAGEFKIDFFAKNNFGIECGFPPSHKTSEKSLKTYKAELDLKNSCVNVEYFDEENVKFERKIWVGAEKDMIFMRVKSSEKGKINFRGYLDRGIWSDNVAAKNGFIFLQDAHGIPFCAGVGVASEDGRTETVGACVTGSGCTEVLFFIDIQSWQWNEKIKNQNDYKNSVKNNYWYKKCEKNLQKIKKEAENQKLSEYVEILCENHKKEFAFYWEKMNLRIGNENESDKTAFELLNSAEKNSVNLINLYANFSRYLLISGSRTPGKLPLTLQGLWNCYMDPPWGSKYTININAEMNYWPANAANLSECEIPLFNLLERAYENGKKVAKQMYGCKGYVLHHNTDFWGDAAPQDAWLPGTYWVLGAAWLSSHVWEHFEYTLDKNFLKKYYYLMHESCRFFADFLIPGDFDSTAQDGKPYLIVSPSVSPENSYVTKTGEVDAFCEGCEMDNMILEHLFKSVLKSQKFAKECCVDKKGKKYGQSDFDDFEYVLNHLKPPELNGDGSLMEWNVPVFEVEPGHRHISHLYGLFPGHTISVEKTLQFAEAAKKTLEKRLLNGGGHTGWSQAWIINFWAQLEQGDDALDSILKLLKNSTLPNLLDNHPPFQIDGNFGALAGILRMIVQSEFCDDGQVRVKLLPALPNEKSWRSGSAKGVRVKGGYSVDFDWRDGKVLNVNLVPQKNALPKEKIAII